jgi:hypothetical protein
MKCRDDLPPITRARDGAEPGTRSIRSPLRLRRSGLWPIRDVAAALLAIELCEYTTFARRGLAL